MLRTLSTYLFVKRKLTTTLISDIARSGMGAMEIFCSRGHFDYRSADAARELASAMRDNSLTVHAVHSPAQRDFNLTRESAAPLSISDLERLRRQEAVDEIKRVLDMAENMPFRYLVQHMGSSHDDADPRRFDAAFISLEELHIFAKQRGVTIALENTPGELATPANLRKFIANTHLTGLRLCFDIGHAHIGGGVLPDFETMRELVVTTHIHDNHSEKDEHLAPYEGTIDWKAALAALHSSAPDAPLVFELKEQPNYAEPTPASVVLNVLRAAFDRVEQELDSPER